MVFDGRSQLIDNRLRFSINLVQKMTSFWSYCRSFKVQIDRKHFLKPDFHFFSAEKNLTKWLDEKNFFKDLFAEKFFEKLRNRI